MTKEDTTMARLMTERFIYRQALELASKEPSPALAQAICQAVLLVADEQTPQETL